MRYLFGTFELQPEERRLPAAGRAVSIGPRAFDLLVALVEHGGRLLTKDELLERVWSRMVVEENARLDQRFALLTTDPRTSSQRQRTLRATPSSTRESRGDGLWP